MEKTIYSKEQFDLLSREKIPEHVAIIMDGNRRWAQQNKLNYFFGHQRGAKNLVKIVKAAAALKIKTLTLYAFSTENWNRSQEEIINLMKLFERYLFKFTPILKKEGIRLKVIGDLSKHSPKMQNHIFEAIEETKEGDLIELSLAVNYGGRDEITRAIKKILIDYDSQKLKKEDITEDKVASYLDTHFCSDPDLLIRTSGESRLSNFLLWQMSYGEFLVTDVLWPEFSPKHLYEAVLEYQKRERRFGTR